MQRALVLCDGDRSAPPTSSSEQQADALRGGPWRARRALELSAADRSAAAVAWLGDLRARWPSSRSFSTRCARAGSRERIAERLGISPRTLRYKLARMRAAGVDLAAVAGSAA